MTMTTKSTRKRVGQTPTPDDHTLCNVDITRSRAVFWQGEQREGMVRDVPKHLAMQWLTEGLAAVVYEPETNAK
jgi:hypothetical protein